MIEKLSAVRFIAADSRVTHTNVPDSAESPVGRLKACFDKWKQATDSKYILDIVKQGYKLSLKEIPECYFEK